VEHSESIIVPIDGLNLEGELAFTPQSLGTVLFAHGSGSSRHSPRNQLVARVLRQHRIGTLLFDLLSRDEEREDQIRGHLRFDISLLARRLLRATHWYRGQHPQAVIGYFGSSTGGAAALVAAAQPDLEIGAIVSRGGRPDLAGAALPEVKAPTLLLVGSRDTQVIELNRQAITRMRCVKELRLIPGATHLFEEPGALEEVASLAAEWFETHFQQRRS